MQRGNITDDNSDSTEASLTLRLASDLQWNVDDSERMRAHEARLGATRRPPVDNRCPLDEAWAHEVDSGVRALSLLSRRVRR